MTVIGEGVKNIELHGFFEKFHISNMKERTL